MRKILIADDKGSSRELLKIVLESPENEIIEAEDGAEALKCARTIAPDLIILDLHMPHFNGFEVLAELRADPKFARTPVLALTASAMQGDRERAIAAGFDSYMSKPIGLPKLRAEVERLLARKSE